MDGVYIHYTKDNVTKAINRGIMFEFSLASSFRGCACLRPTYA